MCHLLRWMWAIYWGDNVSPTEVIMCHLSIVSPRWQLARWQISLVTECLGAHITRNLARIGNNNETSSTTQSTNTAHPDWLRKLDENRKYNLILFGIHDTNNKYEDHRIVDDILRTIGCEHRIANKTNIIRLGNKKPGRSRLLMVCFNSETAASQVLNRSTNLVTSAYQGHI